MTFLAAQKAEGSATLASSGSIRLIEGQGGGVLRNESLALLSKALAGDGGLQIVVALHHPPLRSGIRFMDTIGLANPDALRDVQDRHSAPVRILTGHVHGVYHGLLGRHPLVTPPTGCALIDTASGAAWTELPFAHGEGPFIF
ncbi:MAG: hypothetical protein RID11_10805 [Roseovarius sp.]|jgi:3',5'-cyclic AMP phosphodiesterase CpdA|uniref:hypothetical protein n=1 Tax=Roseovarius sp. TaxID=1486281 RepID=UPI0032EC278E